MVPSYRLALTSLCIIVAIAYGSAGEGKSRDVAAAIGDNSLVSQASRPQAIQLASSAMAAEMRRTDSGSILPTQNNKPAAALAKPQQGKPAAASSAAAKPQQQQPAQAPSVNPSIPGIPLSFYGDTMGRLTKDIRGVYLDLDPQRLLVTMRENGNATAPPSAFTYASRLFCAWSGMGESVGRCDVSANLLPGDPTDQYNRQALTTARCELTAAARACDPQFASGQIILGTGQFGVVLATDATSSVNNVRSFAGDVLVDGVYATGRPDTLLSGVIGFRRGNMRFDVSTAANPILPNSTYSGRVTFSLYKGPF